MTINPITSLPALGALQKTAGARAVVPNPAASFSQALDGLSQSQGNSDQLIQQLARGENVDLHQVMIAADETDINFRVALAMRDKLVEAYHEIMRMSV